MTWLMSAYADIILQIYYVLYDMIWRFQRAYAHKLSMSTGTCYRRSEKSNYDGLLDHLVSWRRMFAHATRHASRSQTQIDRGFPNM